MARQQRPRGTTSAQGNTLTVKAGGNLQKTINAAQGGDTIVVEAGATFVGPVTLPNKGANTPWVTIQSSKIAELPEGARVSPSQAALMPKIVSPGRGESALVVAPGANHYRLLGIEVTSASEDALIYDLVRLGSGGPDQDTLDKMPKDLVIDRSYIHALENQSLKRGIALNSGNTEITNSYISGFKVRGQEAQAILGWNGTGPYKIINNYLEGAGENLMFGGSTGGMPDLVPEGIEIRRNHFYKPLAWRKQGWTVKNVFELKTARNVTVEGNVFENNWADAQDGYAILFTPRPGDSGPRAVVRDVVFANNVVRNTGGGVNILGAEYGISPETLARNIRVANNVFENVSNALGSGVFLKIGDGAEEVVFDHNTIFHTGNIATAYGAPTRRFVFTNNLLAHNEYGVHGDGAGVGNGAISKYFPGAVIRRNVIAGVGWESHYPADNFFPTSLDAVRFADRARGIYRLQASSAFKSKATDGGDVGCDLNQLEAALGGAVK